MGEYTRTTYHGKTMNNRTVAMVKAAEKKLGYELTIIQGSYHKGVGASAGTHDGGGVIDLAPWDYARKVKALRQVGFAAWHRKAIPGLWSEHIHAVAIGDKELSQAARNQVTDYYNHRDGLAGNGWDSTWRPNPIPVFKSPVWVDLSNVLGVFRSPTRPLPGVKRIQSALNTHGNKLAVDGVFGPLTKAAYLKWSGGKEPNMVDLVRLGTGRFKVKK